MRVNFVLPGFSLQPYGGFAVVYRYANELARRGHSVAVVHPRDLDWPVGGIDWIRSWMWRPKMLWITRGGRPPWFAVDEEVDLVFVRRLNERTIPEADAVFATECRTAAPVAALPARCGAKLFLIQGYESWILPQPEVDATWRLPMHKVVIAKWLAEIGRRLGEGDRLSYVPNGFDPAEFPLAIAAHDRDPFRIGLLGHSEELKGTRDGVEAVSLLRRDFPQLSLVLFGTDPRPGWLPDWAEYVESPSRPELSALYNSCAIFLHPSWSEGFPLPPAEALLSGCALVAAANEGVQEYALDGQTALLAPIRDPEALSKQLRTLLVDQDLRLRLAANGNERIRLYTWDKSTDLLEQVLAEVVGREHPVPRPGAAQEATTP